MMRQVFLFSAFFLLVNGACLAQEQASLSQKHVAKIERTKSAKKKLALYKKLFTKDSTIVAKKVEAVKARAADSSRLVHKLLDSQPALKQEVQKQTGRYKIPRKDYKQMVTQYGPEQAREIFSQAKEYNADLKKYKSKYGEFNVEEFKKAKVEQAKNLVQEKFTERSSSIIDQKEIAGYKKEVEAWRKEQFKYNDQLKQLGDSSYLKQQAKEKAEQAAMDFLTNNPAIMKAVQAKTNALMKVYSYVPNSNDLSTAVKRTSLKGRTFKERLVLGGNFQIVTIKPFIVDFFPMIGYKIKSNWSAGVGGSARLSLGSTNAAGSLLAESFGYKASTNYDLFRNFFAYTEFSRNSIGRSSAEEGDALQWKNTWLVGVGRKISVYHKLDMTILALYNFFHDPNDPLYPKAFTIRFGFQLSDTALLNRRSN